MRKGEGAQVFIVCRVREKVCVCVCVCVREIESERERERERMRKQLKGFKMGVLSEQKEQLFFQISFTLTGTIFFISLQIVEKSFQELKLQL